MTDPFAGAPADPTTERELVESVAPKPVQTQEQKDQLGPSDDQLKTLFDGFVYQINRATALLKTVEPEAQKLSVPVDIDAVQVREAIRRRAPGNDGSTIPFDLYKDMIEFYIQSGRKVSFEILGELTGDIGTDAQKIKKYVKSGGKGLSAMEEFLLYADKWLILFMLNRLIGQMQGQEHRECTAPKTPQGTEEGPIGVREQLAAAALMLILGLEDKHVIFATQMINGDRPPPVDFIHKARATKMDELGRAFIEAQGAQDHVLITGYADNYISRHPIGYESWMAYRDLKNMREDAAITYVHAREYSKDHQLLMDYEYKGKHTDPGVGFFGRLAGVQVMTTPMTAVHYNALATKLIGLDVGTSSIAQVLTSGIGADIICCLARFLSRQDVKRLKKIRHMLAVADAAMGGGLNSQMDPLSLMDYITQALIQQAVTYVERIFDQAVLDVQDWFLAKDSKDWDALYECPLIMDLIDLVMQAIHRLKAIIHNMISKYLGNITANYQGIFRRWGSLYDMRRGGTILSVLDAIIANIEMCADFRDKPGDGGDSVPPDPADDPGLTNLGPKPLHLPADVVERFFKTNQKPIPRGPGFRPIPPLGTVLTSTDMNDTNRNFRELCHGIIPDALLDAVAEKGTQ